MKLYIRLTITLFSITILSNCVFPQDYYPEFDFIPQDEVISPNTPESELNEFLKKVKAKAIEFGDSSSRFPLRIKKKKGWALLEPEWSYEESYGKADSTGFSDIYIINKLVGYYIFEKKGFSFDFQDSAISKYYNFIPAEANGKKYVAEINTNEIIIHPTWFDDIEPVIDSVQVYTYNEILDRTLISKTISTTLMLKRGNKWALFAYHIPVLDGNKQLLQMTGFHFSRKEEASQRYYASYQKFIARFIEESGEDYVRFNVDLLLEAKKYFEAHPELDYVRPLWKTISGKQLFAIHSTKTNLWSITPTNASNELSFPNGVSVLKIFENEIIAVAVNNEGKLGFYNSDLSKSLPAEFDEYQSVFLDYFNGCAFRKGNEWELYDCSNLTKLVEGSAPTIDDLIELWLNR